MSPVTRSGRLSPDLSVRAVDRRGATVLQVPLPHGEHPETTLWHNGFRVVDATGVTSVAQPYRLVLDYLVDPVQPGDPQPEVRRVSRDRGLVLAPGEVPVRLQRVAAYALVRTARGLLLTEFSERTNVPGTWGLPGGGIDPGEAPEHAVVREVHEETGQVVVVRDYLGCVDGHWVGRAPDGAAQDFHAVRLVYTAHCPEPSDPVVHDVGGTTESARWVPPAEVGRLPLVSTWQQVLSDVLAGAAE